MRKLFTFVGERGYNLNDEQYSESSLARGYGKLNYYIGELVKRDGITLHSVSIDTVLLPFANNTVMLHMSATVVYEGDITDPIGEPAAHFLGEPGAYRVEL